ncbi:hypothetical protein QE370_001645 [Aeromicrobium sp. SORGH_AS981]|jgi:hypothetical protein|uniref:hypothetical protein n=1 Tax=Aeromicrobium sp. SORGH_AS_0981 TaxID=3041802 RepID=UPI00286715D8|nr:hypothetical protein [Aeromicrobium sp. SORGH_AS_0981]MDR6118461.1 hypothetical protein [Aeromicrobium sp. SORGH_AS_0981]
MKTNARPANMTCSCVASQKAWVRTVQASAPAKAVTTSRPTSMASPMLRPRTKFQTMMAAM